MKQERKKIIIDEIEHWRQSRLLPDQYCDFLSNLYQEPKNMKSHSLTLATLRNGNSKPWFLAFGIISFICFIGFYFSSFSLSLQIATLVIMVVVCYLFAGIYNNRSRMISLILAGAGSLLMLVLGVWIIALHSMYEELWSMVLVTSCGLIWLLIGYILRIGILHYCGIGGWLLLYAVVFVRQLPAISWGELQALWIPLVLLFIGLSGLLHKYKKMLSQVYFSVGLSIWFMPEIDLILLRHQMPSDIVLLCVFKLAVALFLLFIFRKKWIVWVSS
ncbi:hypothetical protein [Paenibacillus crassostreae]|nr:hypothetical protein [Paenibacillus crassostreae]AOZ94586.1 hypothetical protein LPB68_05425 [Paenibacillus crassostreae]